MVNMVKTLEQQESSATWASDKGSCSEAPGGAAEQNLVEGRAGETPLTGEEHLSIGGGRTSHGKYRFFSLGERRIVKTTQLIRKKVFILICINYMFRPTAAIIRFITNLRGSHVSGWGY